MPRVSRERTKYHASSRPPAVGQAPAAPSTFFASIQQPDIVSAPIPLVQPAEPSTGTSSSAQLNESSGPKTKKGKRMERHKKWMDKMNTAKAQQRQEQRQQGRQTDKSALIRGMSQMHSSLREVQEEMLAGDLLGEPAKERKPDVAVQSRKARNKAAIKEEKRFAQVLQHPAFKKDALKTIREHLANSLPQPKE
ncbi:hypothetical protein H4S01_001338 [Coemansia sp. RSA 2610]|nr:hypothetical protein H4S01_001338 [Coemansia sp. RSA 2610]